MALTDTQVQQYLIGKFDKYKEYRQKNQDPGHIENYRLYKSYRDKKLQIWQTNIFLPYVFSMIETILPRLVLYLWQGDRLTKAHPREGTDAYHADIVDDLMYYQIDTQIRNLFLEFVEMLKVYCIQGSGVGKLTWDVYNNRPTFVNKDIFDFYPQPFKKYIDDMDGVFDVFDIPVDVLWQRQKLDAGYKNIDKLIHTSKSAKGEDAQRKKDAEVNRINDYEPKRPTALIYQYWGKVPVQESMEVGTGYSTSIYKEKLCELGNREFVIRNTDNPYTTPYNPDGIRPFITAKNYIDPGEYYGIGDVAPVRDLQYEANELEGAIGDNVKLMINRMWKIGTTAGVNLGTLTSYPGNVIQARDIEQVQEMRHSDVPVSAFKQREEYEKQISAGLGIYDYTKGGNAPGMTDTVGGISALIEEANMRFALKIKIIQMSAIKEFSEKLFMLDKIFIKTIDIPTRVMGEKGADWITINPDNLQGMYDFKPISVTMIGNRLSKQNTMIKLLDALRDAPPIPSVIEGILDQFEVPNKEQVMTELKQYWVISGKVPPPQVMQQMLQGRGSASPTQPGAPAQAAGVA